MLFVLTERRQLKEDVLFFQIKIISCMFPLNVCLIMENIYIPKNPTLLSSEVYN